MTTRQRTDLELLTQYAGALARGQLRRGDLAAPSDRVKLDAVWRWVLRAVKPGPSDPKLLAVVEALLELDPGFPAAHLLHGLALQKVGRAREAREALLTQASAPSGAYSDAALALAELIPTETTP